MLPFLVTDILLYLIFFIELQESALRVIADNYVTDDGRTSVVHCALAFGEDDHCVCLAVGIFEVGIILL
jgi:isoleucyl-tRNA synthetase